MYVLPQALHENFFDEFFVCGGVEDNIVTNGINAWSPHVSEFSDSSEKTKSNILVIKY